MMLKYKKIAAWGILGLVIMLSLMAILPAQWSKQIYFYQKALYGENAKWIDVPPKDYTGKWIYRYSYDTEERVVSHYKNGQLHGKFERYGYTGHRIESTYYENGKKNGLSIEKDYFNNRIIRKYVLYVADVPCTGYVTPDKQGLYIIEHEKVPENKYREWEKRTGGIKAFVDDTGIWKKQYMPNIHVFDAGWVNVEKRIIPTFPAPPKGFSGQWVVYDTIGYLLLKQSYVAGKPSGKRVIISTPTFFEQELSYYLDGIRQGISVRRIPYKNVWMYAGRIKNRNNFQINHEMKEFFIEFCLYKNSFPYLGMYCQDYYNENGSYRITMHYVIDGEVIDDFDAFKDKFTKKYLPLLFRYGACINSPNHHPNPPAEEKQ